MLFRLLIAVVLIAMGAAALAAVGYVMLDGRTGGTPFATLSTPPTPEQGSQGDVDDRPEPAATDPTSTPITTSPETSSP